jgi:hypothetical protein
MGRMNGGIPVPDLVRFFRTLRVDSSVNPPTGADLSALRNLTRAVTPEIAHDMVIRLKGSEPRSQQAAPRFGSTETAFTRRS